MLTTAPVLSYLDYSKPFLLEMDALLKGLGTVLLQEDNEGNLHVISYASHTLKPYEKSMKSYSSAKLELLALKWSVCKKFKNYLIKLFDSISSSQMAENQKRDIQLSLVYEYVANNYKHKLSKIHHVRSKPIRELLLQYDWLSLIRGVLHCQTFIGEDEVQQLILPISLHDKVLYSLHNNNGHQGQQCMLSLLCSKVYWPTMFADMDH